MKNQTPHYAWYCVQSDPAVWALGRWESGMIIDVLAQLARTPENIWQWCAYIPHADGTVYLPMGKASYFDIARRQAELVIWASR